MVNNTITANASHIHGVLWTFWNLGVFNPPPPATGLLFQKVGNRLQQCDKTTWRHLQVCWWNCMFGLRGPWTVPRRRSSLLHQCGRLTEAINETVIKILLTTVWCRQVHRQCSWMRGGAQRVARYNRELSSVIGRHVWDVQNVHHIIGQYLIAWSSHCCVVMQPSDLSIKALRYITYCV